MKIPVKTGVLRISDWAGNVQAIWTSTWAELAPKWVLVAAKLHHGANWSKLGRT